MLYFAETFEESNGIKDIRFDMKLKKSLQDKNQWDEFHSEKSILGLSSLKNTMHDTLVSALDEYTGIHEKGDETIARLNEHKSNKNIPQDIKDIIDKSIQKIQSEIEVSKRFANFYLVLLDINTYAYNCFLAKDDWEWRVFARHIYTVLYEHQNSINILLNDVIRIVKEDVGNRFDIKPFVVTKKAFVKVIDDISDYAKVIRLNVDAHFDGSYEERLKLIEEMSYYEVVRGYCMITGSERQNCYMKRPLSLHLFRMTQLILWLIL